MNLTSTTSQPVEIRALTRADYPLVASWWMAAGQRPPSPEALPEVSSFLISFDGEPALSVTLYLTNCKEVAYLENFVGNPAFARQTRRHLAKILLTHCESFAKALGFKRLLCLAPNEALSKRYSELGLQPTLHSVSTHMKELM